MYMYLDIKKNSMFNVLNENCYSTNSYILTAVIHDYCGWILTIKLFVVPYSTFWSHFIVYIYKCDQNVEYGTIKCSIVRISPLQKSCNLYLVLR